MDSEGAGGKGMNVGVAEPSLGMDICGEGSRWKGVDSCVNRGLVVVGGGGGGWQGVGGCCTVW